jgi:hypothetical protein
VIDLVKRLIEFCLKLRIMIGVGLADLVLLNLMNLGMTVAAALG